MVDAANNKITVLHLVWLPYGFSIFSNFIDSYIQHPAGAQHHLLIVFNGVSAPQQTAVYHNYLRANKIAYQSVDFTRGQDLDCYFRAAANIGTEYITVLNSFSVILADNWLKKYADAIADASIGIAGSSGSLQSYYSSVFQKNSFFWETSKGFADQFRKYKLFVKALLYWRFLFAAFPNPHLRTNAFIIKRTLFLQLQHKPFVTKFAAYQFESGKNSLSKQLLKMALKVVVIDKQGHVYEPAAWKESATFWINQQEGLLVADNQTSIYANASVEEQKKMTKLAWGTT